MIRITRKIGETTPCIVSVYQADFATCGNIAALRLIPVIKNFIF
jgi:hypothetical protein